MRSATDVPAEPPHGVPAATAGGYGDVHVDGYTRGNGTYVRPHYRSAPDGDPYDNYDGSRSGGGSHGLGDDEAINPQALPGPCRGALAPELDRGERPERLDEAPQEAAERPAVGGELAEVAPAPGLVPVPVPRVCPGKETLAKALPSGHDRRLCKAREPRS